MGCPFKDFFGRPGEGVHSTRIGGLAAVDTGMTVVAAFIFAVITGRSFLNVFLILFVLGEFLHWLFCVDTAFIKFLRNN